jgi:hypothetical protein
MFEAEFNYVLEQFKRYVACKRFDISITSPILALNYLSVDRCSLRLSARRVPRYWFCVRAQTTSN